MADYPSGLVSRRVLSDGAAVTIRPIRSDDGDLERRFLTGLSPESRYLRFHKCVNAPSEKLLHFLTDVDYDRHMALVCAASGPRGEELVGEARYVATPDRASCEFGIVIADRWRKSGAAGLLMEALTRIARERGIGVMEGVVLARNRMMLRFARALGFSIEAIPDDPGARRIVKRL